MKKITLFFILIISSNLLLAQGSDSLNIYKVIEKEGLSWRNGDLQGFKSSWLVRPYGGIYISTTDGKFLEVDVARMANVKQEMIGSGGLSIHTNHQFKISGNTAWVSHDQVAIDKYGKASKSKEVRFLEKDNKQWKLIGQSVHMINELKKQNDTVSYIQTVNIETNEIETIASLKGHYEAPNWHPENYLILNTYGKLIKLDLKSKIIKTINTAFADNSNNDHGISPDKKSLVISNFDTLDMAHGTYVSKIYTLPIEGGTPKLITKNTPSFWHGWSPDGKTLAYCAQRNGNFDIYTIPAVGGEETRLTSTEGLDDGPEYSPDGKYIYFNSYRTGHMQIWRMLADGSHPEQITFDENSNWFAHPSPDNKWIVYISYQSDEKQSHLFGRQVKLKLMDIQSKVIKDITPVFFGGQGTINVPSWSSDSKKVAFVSYSIN
ncbi:MAG: TolB family protein [Sediminibacterium sp.]